MNAQQLGHIVRNPDHITVQEALELEELCRKFPAFSTPYILLARYYHQKGDYRADEAAQHAALRVLDREWLYDVVHGLKAVSGIAAAPGEDKLLVKEPTPEQPDTETEAEKTAVPLSVAEEEVPVAEQTAEEEETELPEEPVISAEIRVEITEAEETAPVETEIAEPAMLEPDELKVDEPSEPVYSEIEHIVTDESAELLGITGSVADEELNMVAFEQEWENLPDAGGLITPLTEEEAMEGDNSGEPGFEEQKIETPVLQVKKETSVSDEPQIKPRLIRQAAVYDIEQYYQAESEIPVQPSDFYTWLKNPAAKPAKKEEAAEEPPADHRNELIDRFIKTNPSISRPRKDFFTPETAAKKSENLPDHLVTETLAQVYLKQENPAGAIRIYEKLILKFPEKTTYFAGLIEKIRKDLEL